MFTFQSMYSSLGQESRQSVFIFGSCNGTLIFGVLELRNIDGVCSWSGTGELSASMDAKGKVTVTLPRVAYDRFVLLSAYSLS